MPINAIILLVIALLFLAGFGAALLSSDFQARPSRPRAGYPKPRRRAF